MKENKLLRRVARLYGVTAKEVENDMREAIRMAIVSDDSEAQALWKQLSPDGTEPTVEAFLQFCASNVLGRMEACK